VVHGPIQRKQNQQVMNHWQSTSISGKCDSENARGEGKGSVKSEMRQRARALRRRMTDTERKLWFAVEDRRFGGFKFRRRVPIDRFIADFVCFEARLIIELDGGQHAGSLQAALEQRS
jgi:very-short-patch-repair endonuclease